jgi:hypothetical protein
MNKELIVTHRARLPIDESTPQTSALEGSLFRTAFWLDLGIAPSWN